jgi:hypothetical protein
MALVAMLSTAEFWSGPGGGGVGAALGSRVPSAPLSSRTAPCGVHVWKEPGAGPGCGALGALPGEVGESRGWGRSLSWGPRSSHSWPLPRAQGWVLGGPRPHGGRLAEVLVGCPSCRRGQEPALTPGIQRATPAHGPIVPSVREVCEAGGVSECAAQVGLAPGTGGSPPHPLCLPRCSALGTAWSSLWSPDDGILDTGTAPGEAFGGQSPEDVVSSPLLRMEPSVEKKRPHPGWPDSLGCARPWSTTPSPPAWLLPAGPNPQATS